MLPFTSEELHNAVRDGDVTARKHPSLPYWIYNYAPSVAFDNKWNNVTRSCRGLILDEYDEIIARPWEKFFNLGQVVLPIQFDTPVEVMDKADGSLGIMYPMPNGWNAIATRGSFTSEQAVKATAILNEKYPEVAFNDVDYNDDYTFLFEIIYPENRIVLDYGETEDLILLGAVQNDNGYYCSPLYAKVMLDWKGPVVDVMPFKTISEANAHLERANAEGYVIRSHNFMVKLKQPDYLDLHRLVTNATPRTVWEQLRAGKSRSEIVSAFPDEFHDYISSMIDPLLEAYAKRCDEILEKYTEIVNRPNLTAAMSGTELRKAFAQEVVKDKDRKYFFLMLDNRPIRDALWSELKPREETK